ncbi:APC family permease [Microvirga sp. CF3062]|uniref:APC family permease n=1 Tax=Microvirga sp. CF3062 TaxID=3110182 RepID=UPI002E76F51B|nr:APC family permease [Microvirga sp. CF3062]MEE1655543.1 APC family permease [Microvirga sp. CF3062]
MAGTSALPGDADLGGSSRPELHRSIGPFQLALYGLGSMLGSGVYGLMGQAAGQVGNAVWLAFLVALVAALLTALTYASLGSRYPRAGGAAYVAERAYRSPLIGFVVGLAVACSSLTSVATQSRVFAANLATLTGGGESTVTWLAIGFLLLLTGLVLRGIRESMWVNVLCTCIEAGGLLLVVAVGISYWGSVDLFETPPPGEAASDVMMLLVLQGAVLTFFAFIGFEDSLNVAEECRDPQRTIPIGLIAAMAMAAMIYMAVAITAVSVLPWRELAAAPGPLTAVMERAAPWLSPIVYTAITLFAVANTALVNYVTASRLAYGMSHQGLLPSWLGRVHATRRTPHLAILALFVVVAPLALIGTIGQLAAATVLLLLLVFALMNGALVLLKNRQGEPHGRFEIPAFLPILGCLVCACLVIVRVTTGDWRAPALAGGMIAGILVLYALFRPKADRLSANT